MPTHSVPDSLLQKLEAEVSSLRASTAWKPSKEDLARGKQILTAELKKSGLLPLQEFARLAEKSAQQVCLDIAERRLLALSVEASQQRIPSWQLDEKAQQLTCRVLAQPSLDSWTIYFALTSEYDNLDGRSPVSVVKTQDPEAVATMVLSHLGFHE